MKTITLTQGKIALVDDEDFDRVNQFKWYASKRKHTWYARHGRQYLHRFLLPGVSQIDHKNGNGLDCQKDNLRPASFTQNHANKGKRKGKHSSAFKGVCWDKRSGKWLAYLGFKKRFVNLGYFLDEVEAARAYDVAAQKYFGEFAKINLTTTE